MHDAVRHSRASTPRSRHRTLPGVAASSRRRGAVSFRQTRPGRTCGLPARRLGRRVWVHRPDRVAQSLPHLVQMKQDLGHRGFGFRSLTDPTLSTNRGGRQVVQPLGAVAQFELDLIRFKTSLDLEAVRQRRRIGGRPRPMTVSGKATQDPCRQGVKPVPKKPTVRAKRMPSGVSSVLWASGERLSCKAPQPAKFQLARPPACAPPSAKSIPATGLCGQPWGHGCSLQRDLAVWLQNR